MADLAELQKKQAEAAKFAHSMASEKDPAQLKEMAEQLQAKCADLGRMARAIEAALTPAGGSGVETRVTLSPEQRKRIAGPPASVTPQPHPPAATRVREIQIDTNNVRNHINQQIEPIQNVQSSST